jgi:hypothetical protein
MDASEALAGHTRIPKKNNIKIHFHIIQLCTQPIYKTMDACRRKKGDTIIDLLLNSLNMFRLIASIQLKSLIY